MSERAMAAADAEGDARGAGPADAASGRARADAAFVLLEADPDAAAELAKKILTDSGGPAERARAHRLLALVAGRAGDADDAIRHADAAVSELGAAPELTAEVRLTRASALHATGRSNEALSDARVAADHSIGLARTRARLIEGTILSHTGNVDGALAAFADVESGLGPSDDRDWAMLYFNRSSALVENGRSHEAIPDLDAAVRIFDALGNDTYRDHCRVHLMVASVQSGDIARLFRMWDDLSELDEGRDLRLTGDLGRALLLARLFREALDIAERSIAHIDAGIQDRLASFVFLLAAKANFELGHLEACGRRADAAADLARRSDQPAVAATAELLATAADPDQPVVIDRRVRRALDQLHRVGWPTEELEARLRLARRAEREGNDDVAVELLSPITEPDGQTPAAVAAQHWLAIATRAFLASDPATTDGALERGTERAEELLGVLGSYELRSRHAAVLADLARLGVRQSLHQRQPAADLLTWIERSRAAAMSFGPAPTAHPDLGPLLDEGRRLRQQFSGASPPLAGGTSDPARLAEVEAEVIRRLRANPTDLSPRPSPVDVEELQGELGDRVFISYAFDQGGCNAVIVSSAGFEHRSLDIGPDDIAANLAAIENAAVRLGAGRSGVLAAAALDLLRRRLHLLDESLIHPLLADIDDRAVVISPPGPLLGVPWQGLPSLAASPIDVAPSGSIWMRAGSKAAPTGSLDLIVGPGVQGREAEAIAGLRPATSVWRGEDATTARVMAAATTANVLHLACHGRYRATNPIFSELEMEDGPLWLGDLARLATVPDLIVLAACEAAQSWVAPADDQIGIAAQFLLLGARSVIAPLWITDDEATADLMVELHQNLAAGQSTAAALRSASEAVREASLSHEAASLGFLCLGRSE